MASGTEFVAYAAGQMRGAGSIAYRKMFGEYGLYCNGKFFAVICDDQLFIKITEEGRRICPDLAEAPPYEGAKNYFLVENIDDGETLANLVAATCAALPEPKPKTKPKSKPKAGVKSKPTGGA